MIDGIDWSAIEKARAQLCAKVEVPQGWFTAQAYADRHKITKGAASNLLRRMVLAGGIESQKRGNGLIYRPSGKVHA